MAVQIMLSLTSDSDCLSLHLVRHLEQPPGMLVSGGDGESRKRQDGDEERRRQSNFLRSGLFLSAMLWMCTRQRNKYSSLVNTNNYRLLPMSREDMGYVEILSI